ncbi:DUF2218 domain-containing protein [Microlunatus capsulatus]|uniref:DUF2218 domain-containing protein n=1 Tax=Microlunatus capsulatus TaxID=99117 RepID=A0ABS4ZDC6_9ACTN|nr:DUF2218 domain-containing protein [Microlunatus capsulatus]MBP2419065.1 hypothetical protein [Microlunatus capsulatus]
MAETWTSRADVATDAAERYAEQLASHLGRKAEVRDEPEGRRILVGDGGCLLVVGEAVLELRAEAASAESLTRVQHVVGSHLERFGQRDALVVTWRTPAP